MIIALIALVVLLIGGVALVRSLRTSSLLSGNLAVKRDLLNQGERGFSAAVTALSSGALNTETIRSSDLKSANYVSYQLASNSQGIPLVLVNDSTYSSLGLSLTDITDSSTGITIRYVIDRQCASTGAFSTSTCLYTTSTADSSGSGHLLKPGGESRPAYRITVRVTDTHRNTQTFAQMIAGI